MARQFSRNINESSGSILGAKKYFLITYVGQSFIKKVALATTRLPPMENTGSLSVNRKSLSKPLLECCLVLYFLKLFMIWRSESTHAEFWLVPQFWCSNNITNLMKQRKNRACCKMNWKSRCPIFCSSWQFSIFEKRYLERWGSLL